MKTFSIIIFLFSISIFSTFSQMPINSITISKERGEVQCYMNGESLSYNQLYGMFQTYPNALKELKRAKRRYKTGTVFSYIGGFVFGFCLGSAISGEELDATWGITLGAGAAVGGIGLMIYNSGKKHHKKAVGIYNLSVNRTAYLNKNTLKFGLTNSGIGLCYNF